MYRVSPAVQTSARTTHFPTWCADSHLTWNLTCRAHVSSFPPLPLHNHQGCHHPAPCQRRCAYLTRAQPIGPRLLIHSALSRLNDSVTTVSSPQRPASRPGDLLSTPATRTSRRPSRPTTRMAPLTCSAPCRSVQQHLRLQVAEAVAARRRRTQTALPYTRTHQGTPPCTRHRSPSPAPLGWRDHCSSLVGLPRPRLGHPNSTA